MNEKDLDKIDRTIAEKVMGWKVVGGNESIGWLCKIGESSYRRKWQPTRNISQAMELVPVLRERNRYMNLFDSVEDGWQCCFTLIDDDGFEAVNWVVANTPELAICLAAVECVSNE